MKGFGIFLLVLAGFYFIVSIVALAGENPEAANNLFVMALIPGVIGVFLIHTANRKKREAEEKKHWEDGSDQVGH
ncbi:MAG: hypothetical protein LKI59_09510 [Bacteroidales bacterium]|jgi:hypothetical protein|nr:hypothetical protein [Bacteroidales bacterium]